MRGVKDTGKTLWNTTIDNISSKLNGSLMLSVRRGNYTENGMIA